MTLQNGEHVTDVGDFSLGVKWRLLAGVDSTPIPTLSLFPSVKLPTAPDPIGNERDQSAMQCVGERGARETACRTQ